MILSTTESKFLKLAFEYKKSKNFISVIIPVYRDSEGLTDTLRSLREQTIPQTSYEILVANDGNDASINAVCKKFKVKEVPIKKNLGSYNARNQALTLSRGDFILFTDADVTFPKNWIAKYKAALSSETDYAGGNVIIDKSKVKTLTNRIEFLFGFPVNTFFEVDHFFPTANVAVKRTVIESLGGFDSRLQSGGDLEFGNRVYNANKFILRFIDNPVIHPPRDFHSFVSKLKRVALGRRHLYLLYPDRFKHMRLHFLTELRNALYIPQTPQGINDKGLQLKIRLLLFYFQAVKSFYNIYYLIFERRPPN